MTTAIFNRDSKAGNLWKFAARTVAATLVALPCLVACGDDTSVGDKLVTEYFQQQTKLLTDRTFADIQTLEDWTSRRDEYRRQLFEMLGLDPLPEKTPLQPVVTGTVEADEFVVENLHFQSRPGVYVTANLYRPKNQTGPLPAILYVCGHGGVKKDGVSYGNKTHYQHHGAWFARNGYVCLTIDTIQLGELEGIHHGTYREKMWWWNNRGYSSAGAEAWNCIRSLDYLQSREEVDPERIGVTGRSGGGAYSWWVAALDERIKAAVPVAGITSLHNHVVDGCVEGHCDCMYMVNTYRWDYPMVAALVAPRPLLISNTDKDGIFPLDGVVDVHAKVRKIYRLYDAEDKLGLQITEGPHKDTQELRIHAFRWLNRFLKNDDALIETTATKFFEPEQLKVFDELPADEHVTDLHESFVPAVNGEELPSSRAEFERSRDRWMQQLREKTFRGWPQGDEVEELDVKQVAIAKRDGLTVRAFEFTSQTPYRLPLYVVQPTEQKNSKVAQVDVTVLAENGWKTVSGGLATVMPDHFGTAVAANEEQWAKLKMLAETAPDVALIYCLTRDVGPTLWNQDERRRTHIRRRFMQLGQTADGMKIWDICRALQALDQIDDFASASRGLQAEGLVAAQTLYASLFADHIDRLYLRHLPMSNRQGITLLNVSRFVEMPQVITMAADRVRGLYVTVDPADAKAWRELATTLAQKVLPELSRIRVTLDQPGRSP